jgi:protein CpxP
VKVLTSKLAALATGLALLTGMAMAQDQTAAPATGHNRMHARFMSGAPEMGMLFHRLNLTDEQKTQVKQIFESEKAAIHPLMKQEMAAHQQMIQLITSGDFDQAKASALAAQESQIHLQLVLAHAKIASHIFQTVLTPDQREQAKSMIAAHAARMQQRGQERGESAQPSE